MITDAFQKTTITQNIFDLVFSLLSYGKPQDKCELYTQYKALLVHVENFISYYLNSENVEKVHAFVCFESSIEVRKIVAEYLIVRFGILHPEKIKDINNEIERSRKYGWRVPSQDGSSAGKQYFKNINFLLPQSKNGKMRYGDALKRYKIEVANIAKANICDDNMSSSLILCHEKDLPNNRDSLLPEFYTTKFSRNALLNCNVSYSGESLIDYLIESPSKDVTTDVNAFLIYSNTDQAKLYRDDLVALEQCDYNIKNYFVFYFKKRNYCAKNLKTILQQINIRYTKDVFFLDRKELDCVFETDYGIHKKAFIGNDEDANLYGLELQEILTGIPYSYNYRNILSLCINDRCKEIFFDSICTDTPEYRMPESGEVFLAIRKWWADKILPAIRLFALGSPISFIGKRQKVYYKNSKQK